MLLINNEDRKAIEQEVAELKKSGHAKDITSTQFKRSKDELFIEMVIPGQNDGVALSISPSRESRSIFLTHDLIFMGHVGHIELAKFLKSFPKAVAPTLARLLESDPPEANDQIIRDYGYKTNKLGYSNRS